MTRRAPRPCSTPGCPYLVTDGGARCPDCRRRSDRRRPTAARRGYDQDWRQLRRAFLAAYPWCDFCGPPTRAVQVDHIDGDAWNRSWANLRGLCEPCHRTRTARDQPGGTMRP